MSRHTPHVVALALVFTIVAPQLLVAAPGRITFAQPAARAQSVGPTPELLVEVAQVTPDGHRPVFTSAVRGRPADVEVDPGVYDVFAQHPHSGIIIRLNPEPLVLADDQTGQVASPESVDFRAIARDRHAVWLAKVEAQFAERPDASHVAGDVLVRFHEGTALGAVVDLVDAVGGTIVSRIPQIHVFKVDVEGASVFAVVDALSRSDHVEFAEPNGVLQFAGITPNDSGYTFQQSYVQAIGLEDAWAAFDLDGDGTLSEAEAPSSDIVIAIIDTGIDYSHPDLVDHLWWNTVELYGTPEVGNYSAWCA
ncbi:MAG: hypothetical protein ABGY41_03485, partial [Candidatus Poribacteria bacterium]